MTRQVRQDFLDEQVLVHLLDLGCHTANLQADNDPIDVESQDLRQPGVTMLRRTSHRERIDGRCG